jgi:hypothetical protein
LPVPLKLRISKRHGPHLGGDPDRAKPQSLLVSTNV